MFYSGGHYHYCLFGLISPHRVRAYQFLEANPIGLLPDINSQMLLARVCGQEFDGNTNIHLKSPCEQCSE